MIRNIVFDMGQVLMYFRPDVYIDRLDVPQADRPLLKGAVFGDIQWTQLDRGSISEEEAVRVMCARLPQRLHGYVRSLVCDWWKGPLLPVPGMEALLGELKALGYGLYLLSNAGTCLPEYFDRIPGSQYFDGRIISAQWKQLKPEREIYQTLFREYHLLPEECFFVDDLYINIEAGVFAGMDGYIFRDSVPQLRQALIAAGIPVSP